MRLLLDTSIIVMLSEGGARLPSRLRAPLADMGNAQCASIASLWEMAIKHRSGTLALSVPLDRLADWLRGINVILLPITERHATTDASLPAEVNDPFDRLIVAVAELDGLTLVTTDRQLRDHPLAWRP